MIGLVGRRMVRSLVLCAICGLCATAHAAPTAADRAAAEVLFDDAVKLLESGNATAACPKLEESQRLDPGVGTLLYLADCYRTVGRTASAWATFREASYAAEAANQPDRVQIANSEADKLKPTLSYITLTVADKELAQLEVKRDGKVLHRALWSSPMPVDPGEHLFEASAPGKVPWNKTVVVATGPGTVNIDVPALQAAPEAAAPAAAPVAAPVAAAPAAAPAPVPPPADAENGSSQATWGWVAVGVGGAAIVTGGVFGLLASQANKKADDECRKDDPTRCNSDGVDLADQASSRAMIANVAFGVGLAAATTGVVLLVTAPPSSATASASSSMWLQAKASPQAAGLELKGVW